MADRSELTNLDRIWNDLLAGEARAVDGDSSVVDALRHALTLYLAPVPVSARERARQRVFESTSQPQENTMTASTVPIPLPVPDGRVLPAPRPRLPEIGVRGKRPRWALASIAAALLIVVASLVGGGYYLFEQRNDQPAVFVQPASPEATPGDDKNQYRYGPNRSGVSPSAGPTGQPIELWSVQTQGPITAEPAVVDGVVYIGSGDGNLYAFDAITGEAQWQFEIGSAEASSPAVANGIVYQGTTNGTLYAVDAATGEERWSFAGARDNASPAILDGVLYTTSRDGSLHALNAESGDVIWTASLGAAVSRSATVAGGLVFAGTEGGVFHAFDITSGEERWQFPAVAGEVGTLVAVDGAVFGTIDGLRLYAIDAATGTELWNFQTESGEFMSMPVVSEGTLYTASDSGVAYALDAETGTEKWQFSTSGAFSFAPTLAEGVFYLASDDGQVYGLDAETGSEIFRFSHGGEMNHGPAILDGVAYMGNHLGTFYAIGGSQEPVVQAPAAAASPMATPSSTSELSSELAWATDETLEGLGQPANVTLAPDGSAWLLDVEDLEIIVFSPSGELVDRLDSSQAGGARLFGTNGTTYVYDFENSTIQSYDEDGNLGVSWGGRGTGDGQFLEASDIAIDPVGNLHVVDVQREDVQKFSPDGAYLLTVGGPETPLGPGVGVDRDGNIYAPSGTKVQKFSPNGDLLMTFGNDGSTGGQLGNAVDIAVDDAGNIYVSDDQNNQIKVYDSSGDYVASIGSFGAEPGQFIEPGSLFWRDGLLYVADWGNQRLQVFSVTVPEA